jgi:hypothetical protein
MKNLMSKNNFCGQATLCAYKIRQFVIHLNPFPGSESINTTNTLGCFLKKIVTNAGSIVTFTSMPIIMHDSFLKINVRIYIRGAFEN